MCFCMYFLIVYIIICFYSNIDVVLLLMVILVLNWNVKVVWDKFIEFCFWFLVICDCYGVIEE